MWICDNAACGTWLHTDCIIDSVLTSTLTGIDGDVPSHVSPTSAPSKRGRLSLSKKEPPVVAAPWKGRFSAEILEGKKSDLGDGGIKMLAIRITDLGTGKRQDPSTPTTLPDQRIECLKCGIELRG